MSVIHGTNYGTPTLDLNFAKNKSLIDTVSGRNLVTFSRAQANYLTTYVGADGLIKYASADEPRFDHNPVTGESLGLLIEEARTNYILYTDSFSSSGWATNNAAITENAIAAPDGTLTADLLSDNSSTGTHSVGRGFTNNQSNIVFSCYVKRATARYFAIGGATTSPNAAACFDFDNPNTVTYVSGSINNFTASLTNVGNGWYRITAYHPGLGGSSSCGYYLFLLDTQPANAGGMSGFNYLSYTGTSSLSIYVWGAQVEYGTFPTSYIPTSGSTVTRTADNAEITGTNFSRWYNQTEGTIFCRNNSNKNSSNPNGAYVISDNTPNNRILHAANLSGTAVDLSVINGNVEQVNFRPLTSITIGSFYSTSFAYKTHDFSSSGNGGAVVTDTSGTLPTVNRMDLGFFYPGGSASNTLNGCISRLTYYPTRLQNYQLQQLTK